MKKKKMGFLIVLALGLYISFVMHVNRLRQQVQATQSQWMKMEKIMQATNDAQPPRSKKSPMMIMASLQKIIEAKELNSHLLQLKQEKSDRIILQFKDVDVDQIMMFLSKVMEQESIKVMQLTVKPKGGMGVVGVNLALRP